MIKYIFVLLALSLSTSISAQINVIDFQCVSPTPSTGGGSLRLTLDVNIVDIPEALFLTVEGCNGESITSNRTFQEANNSFSSYVYFPGTNSNTGGCDEDYSGLVSLYYNPDYTFNDANIIDGNIVETIIPISASVSQCNSYFKQIVREAFYDGNLQYDPCNPWLGDCSTEGLVWRQGKVSIGEDLVPSGDVKLSVKGISFTEEFKTCDENISWCDYVFEEAYILKSLTEVEEVIKKEHRLHGMPSEADIIDNNGFELTDIIIRQQEKIEELFLHAIDMRNKLSILEPLIGGEVLVHETNRYKKQMNKINTFKSSASMALSPPPEFSICDAIDCENLLGEYSPQFQAYVLNEIQNTSCKKWEGSCLNGPVSIVDVKARTGKVGIGTNDVPSGFNLAVNGIMRTNELKVFLCEGSWCDYVFEDEYRLPSLSEVEKFIHENKRLPNVPSSSDLIEDKGLLLKEITIIQQEKIEELFLYMIALKEKIENIKNK